MKRIVNFSTLQICENVNRKFTHSLWTRGTKHDLFWCWKFAKIFWLENLFLKIWFFGPIKLAKIFLPEKKTYFWIFDFLVVENLPRFFLLKNLFLNVWFCDRRKLSKIFLPRKNISEDLIFWSALLLLWQGFPTITCCWKISEDFFWISELFFYLWTIFLDFWRFDFLVGTSVVMARLSNHYLLFKTKAAQLTLIKPASANNADRCSEKNLLLLPQNLVENDEMCFCAFSVSKFGWK